MTGVMGHILIADDEETFRLSTAALLQREGYICDCASDSEQALRLLPDRYDLLLADIRMPGNSELDFLRTVHSCMPDLPMVIVTGYPSLPTAVEAVRLATVDYLIKPVDFDQLKKTVSGAVARGRLLRSLQAAAAQSNALAEAFQSMESAVAAGRPGGDMAASTGMAEQALGTALAGIGRLSLLAGQLLAAGGSLSVDRVSQDRLDVCRFIRCSKGNAYEEAIRDALDVIGRTKQAFKSKELAALRLRLEAVLRTPERSIDTL